MNIRAVTYFLDASFPLSEERLRAAGTALAEIKAALEGAGYAVQTLRVALTPFARVLAGDVGKVTRLAQDLEAACFINKIDAASIGPARPTDPPEFFYALPDAIGATENVFASAIIAEPMTGVSLPAVRLAAEVIRRCSTLTPDGFGNQRFAALANVPAGSPFFPAAYHDGGSPVVSVGVEAADLAVSALAEAASLPDARARFVHAVEEHAQKIYNLSKRGGTRGLQSGGVDFSLAPYPEAARSLGTALERLTGVPVGSRGTLAAAAFLADALDRARFRHVGFSGLFLPVLEDAVLASRASSLTLSDLLLYASVCGAGLDTVPLPGDITADALAAILLDVAALALRLNKPLTARLLPIPGKRPGDEVKLDFPYFAPSRVMNPRAAALGGLFAEKETFDLGPRSR
jgi:uncharacterized protein (UPF0210 family)